MACSVKMFIITGVTSGLGSELTKRLIALDHKVFGCGRTKSVIEKLNVQYACKGSEFAVIDLLDQGQIIHWIRDLMKNHGVPDVLINNAAVADDGSEFWKQPYEQFRTVMKTNIEAVALTTHLILPLMLEAKKGLIVNIGSIFGRQPAQTVVNYSSSKHAVEGFSKSVALQIPEPLSCVVVDPGATITSLTMKHYPAEQLQDFYTLEEWGDVALPVFLSLDRSHNGQTIVIKNKIELKDVNPQK